MRITRMVIVVAAFTLEGMLQYEADLTVSHYTVKGWALICEWSLILQRLVGHRVTVTGTEYADVSLLMRRQLIVEALQTTLEGELLRVSNSGEPYYALEGWVVLPEKQISLDGLEGTRVAVSGSVMTEPTLYLKPALNVTLVSPLRPIQGECRGFSPLAARFPFCPKARLCQTVICFCRCGPSLKLPEAWSGGTRSSKQWVSGSVPARTHCEWVRGINL